MKCTEGWKKQCSVPQNNADCPQARDELVLITDASWMLVVLGLCRDVHLCVCVRVFAAGGLKEMGCSDTTHAHAEDSARQTVCSVVANTRTTFK